MFVPLCNVGNLVKGLVGRTFAKGFLPYSKISLGRQHIAQFKVFSLKVSELAFG